METNLMNMLRSHCFRFTLRTLKEFGFGKSGMEDIINNEVEEFSAFLMDEANKAEDGAIDAQNVYNISILNALWRIISGDHNENTDGPCYLQF